MKKERHRLEVKLNSLKQKIRQLPNGELQCFVNGKYIKWYNKQDYVREYIPKGKQYTAEKLAVKKYYQYQTAELEQEIKYLNRTIKNLENLKFKSSEILDEKSNYRELIRLHFEKEDEAAGKWLEKEYEHNNSHPENLKYIT